MKAAKWALRCFYRECLKQSGWTVFEDLRVAEPRSMPVVLSREQVQCLLGAVREPRFRMCLRLMYYCGLRIGEALNLQVRDILSKESPPRLHIRNAKGGKDRYVPVPAVLLEELRAWWRTHRNPKLIFPAPASLKVRAVAQRPMSQTPCR